MIEVLKNQFRGLPAGFRVTTPLLVAAGAIGLSAYVVAVNVGSLLGATISPSVDEESADPLKVLAADSSDFLEKSRLRFDNRSIYSLPTPPKPKLPPPPPPRPVEPPKDPGPPPPPATYTGPSPTGVFGDTVFFGTTRVKLGETSDGIKVTEIKAPYSITVEHMRGTYTVSLFGKGDDKILQATRTSSGASGVKVATGGEAAAAAAAGADATRAGMPGGAAPGGLPGGPAAVPGPVSGPGAGAPNGVGPGGVPQPGGVRGPTQPGSSGDPQPSGDLPSPAMEPQDVPPPPEEPPSEPSSDGAGVDYVDRDHLPPPRSAEQIAAMTIPQAKAALSAIEATASWQVDAQNRARLNHERDLLLERINGTP